MVNLCVAGAAGRMGQAIIAEALARGHRIVGATEAPSSPCVGKRLSDFGIHADTPIQSAEYLTQAVHDADVYISFTAPAADLACIPVVADLGKSIVLGTTGFTADQKKQVTSAISGKVPAVFSPNYSVGINILFKLAEQLGAFPAGYDFSISEIHHTGKQDAPSGTAIKIGEIISRVRGYTTTVSGREGISPRKPEELEVTSMRAGCVAGIHNLVVAGPHEMLRIEHTAFTRSGLAQGAVLAAEWISRQTESKVYSMADVLGLT